MFLQFRRCRSGRLENEWGDRAESGTKYPFLLAMSMPTRNAGPGAFFSLAVSFLESFTLSLRVRPLPMDFPFVAFTWA